MPAPGDGPWVPGIKRPGSPGAVAPFAANDSSPGAATVCTPARWTRRPERLPTPADGHPACPRARVRGRGGHERVKPARGDGPWFSAGIPRPGPLGAVAPSPGQSRALGNGGVHARPMDAPPGTPPRPARWTSRPPPGPGQGLAWPRTHKARARGRPLDFHRKPKARAPGRSGTILREISAPWRRRCARPPDRAPPAILPDGHPARPLVAKPRP